MRRGKSNPAVGVGIAVAGILVVAAVFLFFLLPGLLSPGTKPVIVRGDGRYVLRFGDDFNAALASRDDLGISVVIAVDVSGSMADPPKSGGGPKYIQAAAALAEVERVLERIVASSPPGQVIKVGLLKFNETVSPVLALTPLDAAGIRILKAATENQDNFSPGGKTAIGYAIELGAEWLAQSGTILRSLVIITDGENTEGVEPEKVLEALYSNRNSASKEGYVVSTSSTLLSFVGFDIASDYFRRFAFLGARVTSAADRKQLAGALTSILEADITKLEAPSFGAAPSLGATPGPGGSGEAK